MQCAFGQVPVIRLLLSNQQMGEWRHADMKDTRAQPGKGRLEKRIHDTDVAFLRDKRIMGHLAALSERGEQVRLYLSSLCLKIWSDQLATFSSMVLQKLGPARTC